MQEDRVQEKKLLVADCVNREEETLADYNSCGAIVDLGKLFYDKSQNWQCNRMADGA